MPRKWEHDVVQHSSTTGFFFFLFLYEKVTINLALTQNKIEFL